VDGLGFAALLLVGFTASAEFSSYAFVHPVVRKLPPQHHIAIEQGLLRTFGRVMPALMPLSSLIALLYVFTLGEEVVSTARGVAWAAVVCVVLAVVVTVVVNVPINAATSRWDAEQPPPDWRAVRRRWELFQGLRSWLLLAGFVLLCLSTALRL
jgi:uncharacterized membrane protein